jgi:hypothetical protein
MMIGSGCFKWNHSARQTVDKEYLDDRHPYERHAPQIGYPGHGA